MYQKTNFFGSYQAFKNSNFLVTLVLQKDTKKELLKKKWRKSHFFLNLQNFIDRNNYTNSLEINLQEVSNDKYLKLYKLVVQQIII